MDSADPLNQQHSQSEGQHVLREISKQHQSAYSTHELPEVTGVVRNEGTIQDLFDPYMVPPNFHFSRIHAVICMQSAHRVRQLQPKYIAQRSENSINPSEMNPNEFCPCCNYPLDRNLFPICVHTTQLNELGAGFPLYFHMVTWLSGLMVLLLIIAGIFCLRDNYKADCISELDAGMSENMLMQGTLANFGKTKSPSVAQAWVHLIAIWAILAFYTVLRNRHIHMKRSLDISAITPSDYTVMVTNLPPTVTVEDLKDFLEVNGRPDFVRCKVVKVILVYRMSRYVETKMKVDRLKEKIAVVKKMVELDLQPPYCWFHFRIYPMEHYEKQLERFEEELKAWERLKFQYFTQVAFVTFDQDEEAKSVAKYLDQPEFQGFWDVLRHVVCGKKPSMTKNCLLGYNISARRAPEPADVNWANIGVSRRKVLRKRFLTWTATALVLLASFMLVYFAQQLRSVSTDGVDSSSSADQVEFSFLSFGPSLIVIIINMLLSRIIRFFTHYEKHITNTSYHTSVAVKQTIALFLNTALVPLVVHWGEFYSRHGLAEEINYIMIANAVVYPVAYIFNPPWVVRWLCRKIEVRKNNKCMLTQLEANKLLEGRHLDMPQRYASLMKTYLFTLVYAPMVPMAFVFGVVALVIQYWLDKVMLLRYLARPEVLGHSLDESMLQVIPLGAVLYAFANWIFFYNMEPASRVPGIIGIVTSSACFILPWKKIFKLIRHRRNRVFHDVSALSESEKAYDEVAVEFAEDYDRSNPLTVEEGNRNWLELIRRKRGGEIAEMMAEAIRSGPRGRSRRLSLLKPENESSLLFRGFVANQFQRHHEKVPEEAKGLISTGATLTTPKLRLRELIKSDNDPGAPAPAPLPTV